jgi:hypothetical protein
VFSTVARRSKLQKRKASFRRPKVHMLSHTVGRYAVLALIASAIVSSGVSYCSVWNGRPDVSVATHRCNAATCRRPPCA